PRRIIWFGAKEQRPYRLSVLRSGANPLPVEGTYVQRGFLPRWLATFFGVFLALAITFVMLWIAYKPSVSSGATESVVEAGGALTPSPTPTPALTPDAQVPSTAEEQPVQEQPTETKSAKSRSGSGSSGGGTKSGGSTKASPKQTAQVVGQLIIGQGSDRCIDVTDGDDGVGRDGTRLQLWDCAGSANQKWDFRGDGTVRSLGMCMDVAWGSKDDGAAIQLARCSGNPAQQFVLSQAGDLVNPQADKCVDATDNGTGNGTKLQLWTCSGTPNQKWRVE
ncbi:ricin-type beta-trefoil lectin domain protein, partial [Streptomyces sp. 7R007]